MKKLISILLLFIASFTYAQQPSDAELIQSPSFWQSDRDTSQYMYNDLKDTWGRVYDYWSLGGESTPLSIKYGYLYNWYALSDTTTSNTPLYGYLYNWYAIDEASPISAANAHVPTGAEWDDLWTWLHSQYPDNEGGIVKESDYVYWDSPNTSANNWTGFNARGTGIRRSDGTFDSFKTFSEFWGATQIYPYNSYVRALQNTTGSFGDDADNPEVGNPIRLIVDSPIEISGSLGIYVGNDGQRYTCRKFPYGSGVWWTTQNLIETKYQDGSSIPEVTSNSTWAGLTTGARCSYSNDPEGAYTSSIIVNSIAKANAHVPTQAEMIDLSTYLDSNEGGKLKETGTTHWIDPNIDATNETGFTARGSGSRYEDGTYAELGYTNYLLTTTTTEGDPTSGQVYYTSNEDGNFSNTTLSKKYGLSVRLIVDTPDHDNGDNTGTYIGTNGITYRIVKINGVWYMAESLIETQWSNGATIPNVTNPTSWAALTTGAYCSYNNLSSNAFIPAIGAIGGLKIKARNKLTFANTETIEWNTSTLTDSTYRVEANVTNGGLLPFYTSGTDSALMTTIKHGSSYGDNLIMGQEDASGIHRDTTFTGSSNTLYGSRVAPFLTKGVGNTYIGNISGYYSTEGSYNTAIGMQAGSQMTEEAKRNIMIGRMSGSSDAYDLTNDSDMVVIGSSASKSVNTILRNGIAIGNRTLLSKSNQVVLGNDSISETILRGIVSVPQLKVITAGYGDNKYLKSDTDGLLSYSDLPALPDTVDNHQQVTDITAITGTGSIVDLTGITSTYTPIGRHALILFSTNLIDSGSHAVNIYITVNGTDVFSGTCETYSNATQYSTQYVSSVTTGSNTIKIRWNAATTVQARANSLTIIDLP